MCDTYNYWLNKAIHRNFTKFRNKCPAGEYILHYFHKICRICTSLKDALTVKTWMDLLKGYGFMGVLS